MSHKSEAAISSKRLHRGCVGQPSRHQKSWLLSNEAGTSGKFPETHKSTSLSSHNREFRDGLDKTVQHHVAVLAKGWELQSTQWLARLVFQRDLCWD